MINKLKMVFFFLCENISPYLGRGFSSERLYNSFYKQKNVKEAIKWVSKSDTHKFLSLEYLSCQYSDKSIDIFFRDNKKALSDNLDFLSLELATEYISHLFVNNRSEFQQIKGSERLDDFRNIVGNCTIEYDCVKDIRRNFYIYNRIKSDLRFGDLVLAKPFLLSDDFSYADIIKWVKLRSWSKKNKLKILTLVYKNNKCEELKSYIVTELLGNSSKYSFDILHSFGQIEAMTRCYNKNLSIRMSPKRRIAVMYFMSNYREIIKIYGFLKFIRHRSSILQARNYITYAYYNNEPNNLKKLVDGLKAINIPINTLEIYYSAFFHGNKETNIKRMELESGLGRFIDRNINRINLNEVESSLFGDSKKNILLISESGVADEIRWSYLYRILNERLKKNEIVKVSIVCEPRYYELFSELYPNIEFVPHKRKFRGSGESTISFHKSNIPQDINKYERVYPVSVLFNILDDSEIETTVRQDLMVHNNGKIKIGVMFSSSLEQGVRKQRYAILPELMVDALNDLKARHRNVEFVCIQSPVSEDVKSLCDSYNISIPNDVDLYNDFYGSYDYYKNLDYVVGPSSLTTELAAAAGSIFFHICNSPEAIYMRNGSISKLDQSDIMGCNTISVPPVNGFYDRTPSEITEDCLNNFVRLIDYQINSAKVKANLKQEC